MSNPLPSEQVTSNIVTDVIFSFITCGIYNLFWNARQFRGLNAFLGQERFKFWPWLLLSIVTCGIYHIYTEYMIGNAIVEIQRGLNRTVSSGLPTICVLVSIFGFTIAADAIQQAEINQLYGQ